jgi:hypothetical protein
MRHSVFTLEVCARIDTGTAMLDQLRPLVVNAPTTLTREEAWQRHSDAATTILRGFDGVERGCWEYFDDEATAMATFDDWCRPVLDQAVPRQGPSGAEGYRQGAGPRYLIFTLVYLLAYGSPSDLEVRSECSVPEADLWKRSTFRSLLGVVRSLSFASVKGDSMYMAPRDVDWGLTAEDLEGTPYHYLRALTGL